MTLEFIMPLYGLLKFIFYSYWISKIPPTPLGKKSIFIFAFIRLILGIILGIAAGYLGLLVTLGVVSSGKTWAFIFLPSYLAYIPIRYIEWGLMTLIIRKKIWNKELQFWILKGIAVSYLCDLVMHLIAIIFKFEVGRIFC
jgi:hypothetical protein